MLATLTNSIKSPPHVICKTMVKEQLPAEIIVRCQNQGGVSTDVIKDSVSIIWNRDQMCF